jgi:hypothetical protein
MKESGKATPSSLLGAERKSACCGAQSAEPSTAARFLSSKPQTGNNDRENDRRRITPAVLPCSIFESILGRR